MPRRYWFHDTAAGAACLPPNLLLSSVMACRSHSEQAILWTNMDGPHAFLYGEREWVAHRTRESWEVCVWGSVGKFIIFPWTIYNGDELSSLVGRLWLWFRYWELERYSRLVGCYIRTIKFWLRLTKLATDRVAKNSRSVIIQAWHI